jgi:hypothetical protein
VIAMLALAPIVVALGLGVFSSLMFVWQWMFGAPGQLTTLVLLIAVTAVSVFVFVRLRRRIPGSPTARGEYWILFGLALAFVGYRIVLQAMSAPEGEYDAWAVWNLHARFLHRGGSGPWKDLFDAALFWSHPNYPLLLPALVHGMWTIAGSEQQWIPAFLAGSFTFLTIGTVGGAISILSRDQRGALAGLVLLATPSFVIAASAQTADIPVALYILTTVVLLRFSEEWPSVRTPMLALAGLSAGLAAWTKNEGLVVVAALFATHLTMVALRRNWRHYLKETATIGAGLAPILILILAFKTFLAPNGDIQFNASAVERVAMPGRYLAILDGFTSGVMIFGDAVGGMNPGVLLVLFLLLYISPMKPARYVSLALLLVPFLLLTADLAVYATTRERVESLMAGSLQRLLIQVWPVCVFVVGAISLPHASSTPLTSYGQHPPGPNRPFSAEDTVSGVAFR